MDKFIPNGNYVATINFAPKLMTENMVSFHLVWPWNKLNGFDVYI